MPPKQTFKKSRKPQLQASKQTVHVDTEIEAPAMGRGARKRRSSTMLKGTTAAPEEDEEAYVAVPGTPSIRFRMGLPPSWRVSHQREDEDVVVPGTPSIRLNMGPPPRKQKPPTEQGASKKRKPIQQQSQSSQSSIVNPPLVPESGLSN